MELSFDLMKQFMRNAPVNIFFKDTECKYLFASEICSLVYAMKTEGLQEKQILKSSLFQSLEGFIMRMIKKFWQQEREANMSVRFR